LLILLNLRVFASLHFAYSANKGLIYIGLLVGFR